MAIIALVFLLSASITIKAIGMLHRNDTYSNNESTGIEEVVVA